MITTSYSKAIFVLFCFFLFCKQAQLIVRLMQTKAITMKIFLIVIVTMMLAIKVALKVKRGKLKGKHCMISARNVIH